MCSLPFPRVMTRLLDYPETMVLPWHEVLEPCLNCLNGPSSDSEVPDPWQGLEEGKQKLGHHHLPWEALEVQQIRVGLRVSGHCGLWRKERKAGVTPQSRQALLSPSQDLYIME